MVIGLVLSACREQPAFYGSHSYSCCTENTGNLIWQAGQRVTLHWQPTPPGRTTDPNPRQIILSVSLTGPFVSIDALKQATSLLDLPTDLPPGYYNLATQAAEAGGSVGGGAIVVVVPSP